MQADEVIRPALIWCDQRSQAQVISFNDNVGRDKVLACTANPVVTGFTLPKLLWVRDNEPQNFERVRKVLLPKDYVRFKLTGEYATEVSDASGTSLFDVVNRRWSYEMCDALGLDRSILPECYRIGRNQRQADRRDVRQITRTCRRVRRSSAAAATRPRAPSETASSRSGSFPAHWAPRALCSRTWISRTTIRRAGFTPSAMPFRASGT